MGEGTYVYQAVNLVCEDHSPNWEAGVKCGSLKFLMEQEVK